MSDVTSTKVYAWTVPRSVLARWFEELERVRPGSGHLDLDREGLGRPIDEFLTRDHLVRLQPPWSGGKVEHSLDRRSLRSAGARGIGRSP
jgi:hypothetical protein